MKINNINEFIDHTLLKPFAKECEIEKLCKEAAKFKFKSVCVNPCNVKLAKRLLENTDVCVCTVIGFPLGANKTEVKEFETRIAYGDGCDEFDMVINIGALKDNNDELVKNDIRAVVNAACGKIVKVIIETLYLTDEEKVRACRLAEDAGAHFVKTCTGFNEGVATVKDVRIMKESVCGKIKVKASAGIRDCDKAIELIDAGADRLGTSAGVKIFEGKYENH